MHDEKGSCCSGGSCGTKCGCPHHKVPMLCVTLIGLMFLLSALGYVGAGTTAVVWPILLIVFGLTKLMGGGCKCC